MQSGRVIHHSISRASRSEWKRMLMIEDDFHTVLLAVRLQDGTVNEVRLTILPFAA